MAFQTSMSIEELRARNEQSQQRAAASKDQPQTPPTSQPQKG